MSDSDPRDPRWELARKITKRDRIRPSLVGASTAGGSNPSAPQFVLPTGTDGQILALVDIGGMLIPQFVDAPVPIGSGGQYREYTLISDGAGGFDFIDDGFGAPVSTLEDLQ